MSAILKFDFQKKKTMTFFWSKLSKLHKKDLILHVATSFSLKQGETGTSHGPISHPLKQLWFNVGLVSLRTCLPCVLTFLKSLIRLIELGSFPSHLFQLICGNYFIISETTNGSVTGFVAIPSAIFFPDYGVTNLSTI